jgi:hypothetical protein
LWVWSQSGLHSKILTQKHKHNKDVFIKWRTSNSPLLTGCSECMGNTSLGQEESTAEYSALITSIINSFDHQSHYYVLRKSTEYGILLSVSSFHRWTTWGTRGIAQWGPWFNLTEILWNCPFSFTLYICMVLFEDIVFGYGDY